MASDSQRKVVYTIIEKEVGAGEDAKSFWVRIGSAFVNRDGSLNVKLDALPVNGTMQIRDPAPKEDDERSGRRDEPTRGREAPRGRSFDRGSR